MTADMEILTNLENAFAMYLMFILIVMASGVYAVIRFATRKKDHKAEQVRLKIVRRATHHFPDRRGREYTSSFLDGIENKGDISTAEAQRLVKKFREAYPDITDEWIRENTSSFLDGVEEGEKQTDELRGEHAAFKPYPDNLTIPTNDEPESESEYVDHSELIYGANIASPPPILEEYAFSPRKRKRRNADRLQPNPNAPFSRDINDDEEMERTQTELRSGHTSADSDHTNDSATPILGDSD